MGTIDILTKWTLDREQELLDNYEKKNIKASGEFGRTLVHTVTSNSLEIRGKKYIGGTIYGRKPNADKTKDGLQKWAKTFAPIMQRWANNKGIGDGSWGLGFAIAYKIAKSGWAIPNSANPANDGGILKDTFSPKSIQELNKELGRYYLTEASQITKQIFEKWRQ